MSRAVHYIAYEPPLAAVTACGRRIPYEGEVVRFEFRGTISLAAMDVTCERCLAFLRTWPDHAPRVLPPTDEVPL